MAATAGVLADRFPYVRFGSGPRTIVILPGMALDNTPHGGLTARAYARGFARLAAGHTVYIVNRGRGLADGAQTRDIAADYARFLGDLGPFSVVGLSTGGMIAQYLALDHPDLVDRLVLVVAGSRIAPAGREILQRWRSLATEQRWRDLRGDLATAVVDGRFAQRLAGAVGALTGGKPPAGTDVADFLTTVDADLAHDATTDLAGLSRPTMVIGGAVDPFFPAESLHLTAAAIPGATLRVHDGVGHGLPKRHGRLLQEQILEHLEGTRS
jgi:pimeloyl-ACP methyl ester carboxylesterase